MTVRNLLLIVIDQFRADLLKGNLAHLVPTPNLDRFAAQSVWYQNHHTVVVPCGPSRASLLTGQYASKHNCMYNGAPLSNHHPTLPGELRKLGREPLLFGYTDTQADPKGLAPNDPANFSYTAPMQGFTEVLEMRDEAWAWLAYLRQKGYDVPDAQSADFPNLYRPKTGALGGPALYSAKDSDTAFLTDNVIAQLDVRKARPWSAMVSYIRPHPPFVAPAPYHDLIDPDTLPAPAPQPCDHPYFDQYHAESSAQDMFWGFDGDHRTLTADQIAKVRATYLGLAAEVDHHIGRLLAWLEKTGQDKETLVVITADHGEMLGDFGLWGKQTPFRQASHIPLMIRGSETAPRVETRPSQSIDVMPTILSQLGGFAPNSMNGQDLNQQTDLNEAIVELDLSSVPGPNRFRSTKNPSSRAVALENQACRLVQFANGMPPMLFSLETGNVLTDDNQRSAMQDRLMSRLIGSVANF